MNFEQLDLFALMETLPPPEPEKPKVNTMFDPFLIYGGNNRRSKSEIIYAFQKNLPIEDIARLMKKLYHGGNGINGVSAVYGDEILIQEGKSVNPAYAARMSWIDAANRVKTLIDDKTFASIAEFDAAKRSYEQKVAEYLWYMFRDLKERSEYDKKYLCHGFPEDICLLAVNFVERMDELMEELDRLVELYEQDKSIMRFRFHDPVTARRYVKYMLRPNVNKFVGNLNTLPTCNEFITENEISDAFTSQGSGVCEWRTRIKAFFDEHKDAKARESFLKNEYGIGGRSHALSGADYSSESHDAKGIVFTKRNCADVKISWKEAVSRYERMFYGKDK